MNQLATINPVGAVPAPAFTMSDMERVALAIAKGGLFGSTDPNAVLTLCMLAQAEGQHPAVVFRDYHIISGKPAKKAEAMHRDFLAAGGKIDWHRCDDECADATFSHPQGGSMRITWDNARVSQAQLTGNAMHKKYPRQMKRSRVISEGVRSVFPMATSGLYESGEVQDIVAQDSSTKPSTPQAQRARDLNPGREKAEVWVRDQLASVESAADGDTLDAVMQGGAKAMAKLGREHGDLHQKVSDAYQRRAAELQEGRADEQHGETHTDTDAMNATADDIIARAKRVELLADLKALEGEAADHIDAMDDVLAQACRDALAAAGKRIGGGK